MQKVTLEHLKFIVSLYYDIAKSLSFPKIIVRCFCNLAHGILSSPVSCWKIFIVGVLQLDVFF